MLYSSFIRILINFVALSITVYFLPGIRINNWGTCILSAVVLTLINTFLKPIIMFLTLPLNILSLGLFTLFINGTIFYLGSKIISGFSIDTYYHAFFGAIIFSVVSFLLNLIFRQDNKTFKWKFNRYNFTEKNSRSRYRTVVDAESDIRESNQISAKSVSIDEKE